MQLRKQVDTSSRETVGARCWVLVMVSGMGHVITSRGRSFRAVSESTVSMPSSALHVCTEYFVPLVLRTTSLTCVHSTKRLAVDIRANPRPHSTVRNKNSVLMRARLVQSRRLRPLTSFGYVLNVNITWPQAWWSSPLASETSQLIYEIKSNQKAFIVYNFHLGIISRLCRRILF